MKTNLEDLSKMRDEKGRFIKGIHNNPSTEFKKGKLSPRKGVKKPGWTNQTSFKPQKALWEKNVREYQQVHAWIIRTVGKPDFCEICKRADKKLYHWANKTGKYLRELSDWMRLCVDCHKKYDNKRTAINRIGKLLMDVLYQRSTVFFIGNGGSLTQADHFAGELLGRFEYDRKPLSAVSLSNPAVITAIANDYGYDRIFSRQIEGLGKRGDLLVCLTSSDVDDNTGHSLNLKKALSIAMNKKKMNIVVLGSFKTIKLRNYANCFIQGEGLSTSEIQEDHQFIIHAVCRYVETVLNYRKITDKKYEDSL